MIKTLRTLCWILICWKLGDCTRFIRTYIIPDLWHTYLKKNSALPRKGSGWRWKPTLSFSEKIALIALKVGSYNNPKQLFASKDFEVIYRYPKTYLPYLYLLLDDFHIPMGHKQIALYGMEQLPYKVYFGLVNHCIRLHDEGKIDEKTLIIALGYALAGDHPVVTHYRQRGVQNIWEQLKNPTPRLQQHMHNIRTGALLQRWNQQKIANQFHWEKKPIPFYETIVKISEKSFFWYLATTEGLLHDQQFMMLYEHPSDYIQQINLAKMFVEVPKMLLALSPESLKCYPGRVYQDVFINAMRKLAPDQFLQLIINLQTYQLKYEEHDSIYTLFGSWMGNQRGVNAYDTLAFKPYPISTHLEQYNHCPNEIQKEFKRYIQEVLPQIDDQKKLYGIPPFDEKKPFYWFG